MLLLRRIDRQLTCMDALLLHAELMQGNDTIELAARRDSREFADFGREVSALALPALYLPVTPPSHPTITLTAASNSQAIPSG
jgi:hypothetical protein